MLKLLIILLLSLCSQFVNGQKDYSRDKHMLAGNIISTGVGIGTYHLTHKMGLSVGVGFASAVLVGYLKEEIYDKRMGKGTYSRLDMMDTGWGASVGSLIVVVYIDVNRKNKQERIDYK